MIDNHTDTRGRPRLVVQKVHSPDTGALSTISAEFSAQGWNKITVEYLESVKQLGTKRLKAIFDLAKGLDPKYASGEFDAEELPSGRATLCSDEETGKISYYWCLNIELTYTYFQIFSRTLD
jgi:hypothetical protein